ncbi:MAG: hypothetical protein LC723_14420, partial [Actinobacteria bacterium]|nr:hypothetical protein [Actinomycetota bacterium]
MLAPKGGMSVHVPVRCVVEPEQYLPIAVERQVIADLGFSMVKRQLEKLVQVPPRRGDMKEVLLWPDRVPGDPH